jgi:hypothetical protein
MYWKPYRQCQYISLFGVYEFDTHGSVHRRLLSRNTNKMQFCNRIYYSKVYWRLNLFWATHSSSSGALNCICSLWFICCNKVIDFVTISVSNRCDLVFLYLFHISSLSLHVSGLLRPIIRSILSCCYATIWFMQCLLTVRVPCELVCGGGHLHKPVHRAHGRSTNIAWTKW